MRFKSFSVFVAALLLSLSALSASAQTTQVNGKIVLRQADGTEVPAQGATVTFYRTDISGKYDVKTNSKGEYTRLGMPLGATYTVVVSAPNARPSYQSNVRLSGQAVDFALSPGDGRVLTLADASADAANAPASGGAAAAAAPKVDEAEARRLAAERAKEIAEVEKKNARATELNAKLPDILKRGNDAFSSKNYEVAITAYDEGIAADPEQGVFYLNKSVALRDRGVNRYNDGLKTKNQEDRTSGRADLKASVDAAEKAVEVYRTAGKGQAGGAAAGGQKQQTDLMTALSSRAESYRIAMAASTPGVADAAAKAIEEYIAVETDATKKNKMQGELVKALVESSDTDDAVASFRRMLTADPNNAMAMYGLGMKLSADPAKAAEASRTLRDFAAKAKGQEFADKRTEAVAVADSLDEYIKTEQQPKTPAAAPARGSRRRGQ